MRKKVISLTKYKKYLFLLPLFFGVFSVTYAINSISTGYQITSSSQTINVHGSCRIVRTTSGSNVFAPTKTATEWNSFINYKPSNVSVTACPPPCTDWMYSATSSNYTHWMVFKSSGSFRLYWQQSPNSTPLLTTGTPASATSYVTGGYRYERGSVISDSSYYATYYIRRCPV